MLDICVMLDILLYFKGFQGIIMPDIGIMCDIIAIKNSPFRRRVNKKGFEFVCKPSSVVYGHLSRLTVTDKLKRYSRYSVGRTALLTETQSCCGWGLHGILCYHSIGELLPRLSILTVNGRYHEGKLKAKGQAVYGGLFLLHCPGGHPRLTLSGTLSYAARTFLMII